MPDLTIDITPLCGPTSWLEGQRWEITGHPATGVDTYIGGPDIGLFGELDADGQAVVDLPETPSGAWLVLVLPALKVSWKFTMSADDADLSARVSAYSG